MRFRHVKPPRIKALLHVAEEVDRGVQRCRYLLLWLHLKFGKNQYPNVSRENMSIGAQVSCRSHIGGLLSNPLAVSLLGHPFRFSITCLRFLWLAECL
jgi:hypothetical protein